VEIDDTRLRCAHLWLCVSKRRRIPAATVSRKSLLSDLTNLTDRTARMSRHIAQLERRLSEALGQEAWQASGLGAPADVDALQQRITQLDQDVVDFKAQLTDRDDDLAAARTTYRELMVQLNATRPAPH
jgi:hypothetical protein